MTEDDKSQARAFRRKVKAWDSLHDRAPSAVVEDARTGPPVISWHRQGCRCRVVRVWLTPEGWHLLGDDYRVPPDEWLESVGAVNEDGSPATLEDGTPITLDARDAGRIGFAGLRKVAGMTATLPLDVREWDATLRFPVGCDHTGGSVLVSLGQLADHAERFRSTGKHLRGTRVPLDRE